MGLGFGRGTGFGAVCRVRFRPDVCGSRSLIVEAVLTVGQEGFRRVSGLGPTTSEACVDCIGFWASDRISSMVLRVRHEILRKFRQHSKPKTLNPKTTPSVKKD